MRVALACCSIVAVGGEAVARNVRIDGPQFVLSATSEPIVLAGPNIVVKGPPWIPSVSGDSVCNDNVNAECAATGSCTSCTTFNQADIDHLKAYGWNFIRLGVMWAGAQPKDEDALDPDFLERLHAVLNLTDANGIHVMLDNHGDMVGTAGCGNGAPMWFQQEAAPDLIGKPLKTDFPYNLIKEITVTNVGGYDVCGTDEEKWAQYAGHPNYNMLNECCKAMNSGGNPGGLGFTTIQQKTMDYSIQPGQGRDKFVRYWRLMAEAVKDHPSAFAFELQNEPMTIRRKWMFDAWRACAEAINEIIPDASVSIADVGEGSVLPAWITEITGGLEDISSETEKWIKDSNNAFYAWHYGDYPTNIKNMQAISRKWNVPSFGTELSCDSWKAALESNISHSYWHYSAYCTTGSHFGNRKFPDETFGACVLGWGSGTSSGCFAPTQEEEALV